MNKTQRVNIIKGILKKEFLSINLELVSSPNNQPFDVYRLRNPLRSYLANKIEEALSSES